MPKLSAFTELYVAAFHWRINPKDERDRLVRAVERYERDGPPARRTNEAQFARACAAAVMATPQQIELARNGLAEIMALVKDQVPKEEQASLPLWTERADLQ